MTLWLVPDWKEKIVYAADGPQPQIILEEARYKVILAGLEARPAHSLASRSGGRLPLS